MDKDIKVVRFTLGRLIENTVQKSLQKKTKNENKLWCNTSGKLWYKRHINKNW
ncbi:hypothetical protein [Phthorimaea operculella granulovirus]|uniref:Uncharacterized protein n=1 Tax=Phthorimaea operculella granulovirus TaxID=192584 RepID=Q8JRU1_9BBAC|nr:hypothetical protein [Phthorimaea operculella granulovirus]AAM70316.1 hypothetical protein [Phthorimaea operculella granulovirus]QBH65953.1 hypothetical protein PhopGVgp118 [Phthorimaea operculella granulovirus]QBH66083.1 hypothetical protein PhopGVgp118 [Phthorimaea operculella granulovirus]QBH66213.1 hypothetical protein PhopGVgp118 [Phthorimaea operculella granulovirus]QBH66343.1 hypothetical protein PhopGVgp118 [Phthorimaea operculella granulovirus]